MKRSKSKIKSASLTTNAVEAINLPAEFKEDGKIEVQPEKNKRSKETIAWLQYRPHYDSAHTILAYNKKVDGNVLELTTELAIEAKRINSGKLETVEAMLLAQARSLEAIFNKLAQQAIKSEYINHIESLLKLGLKAQSQCRTTLELANEPSPYCLCKTAKYGLSEASE